jgi:hypothetical protein
VDIDTPIGMDFLIYVSPVDVLYAVYMVYVLYVLQTQSQCHFAYPFTCSSVSLLPDVYVSAVNSWRSRGDLAALLIG